MSSTGYTWLELDEEMNLTRLYYLTEHWHDSPPLHIAFAGFIRGLAGSRSKQSESEQHAKGSSRRESMGAVPESRDYPTDSPRDSTDLSNPGVRMQISKEIPIHMMRRRSRVQGKLGLDGRG